MNIDITLTASELEIIALEEIKRRYGQVLAQNISELKIEVQSPDFKSNWQSTFNLRLQVEVKN